MRPTPSTRPLHHLAVPAAAICKAEKGLVVKDDIQYGYGSVILRWHFGMND